MKVKWMRYEQVYRKEGLSKKNKPYKVYGYYKIICQNCGTVHKFDFNSSFNDCNKYNCLMCGFDVAPLPF